MATQLTSQRKKVHDFEQATVANSFSQAAMHHAQGRWAQAQDIYEKLIEQQPRLADAHLCLGNLFKEMGAFEKALTCYAKVLALAPLSAQAHFNHANTLKDLQRYAESVAGFQRAIALQPDYAQAHNNLGNAFDSLQRPHEALVCYDHALTLMPQSAIILSNRASTLKHLGRLEASLASFEQAYFLNPNQDLLLGNLLALKMQMCDWSQLEKALDAYRVLIRSGKCVAVPFIGLALLDEPQLHLRTAQTYAKAKHPVRALSEPFKSSKSGEKIRLGYYSADFHNHATAFLIAELIERHDRSRYEVIGFSFGPDSQDEMRQRLMNSFDQFHDVRDLCDHDIAKTSRKIGIDIAIDLKGYTQYSRPSVFAYRCAPVQVSYLGYPGTLGADYMDYIVADETVMPAEQHINCSEKVVTMPRSYQVNDSQRVISQRIFTRQELGLPTSAFVFCCFNQSYKILPASFASWMRILQAVPGSVLWLFKENPIAERNLRLAAQQHGISPDRLVFAEPMPIAEHLARYRLADLFIDTLPCNAHTTASDALWAGLPVLTCMGQSFASRVAASLLQALDLSELISQSPEAYESAAISLATDPAALKKIIAKLASNRLTSTLFDAKLFASHLEQAFETMQARRLQNLPPQSFQVKLLA
jgi:protein O-GlcNAc transferase